MLSNMQKVTVEKIEPAHGLRKISLPISLIACGAFVLYVALTTLSTWPKTDSVKIDATVYRLQLAEAPETRAKGLGGRVSMAKDEGMLFVFDKSAVQCFWMKDMHFALDIIWLDAQKRILHIEKNVLPETFPKQYCPTEPARYVIELNAGQATRTHIATGQRLKF